MADFTVRSFLVSSIQVLLLGLVILPLQLLLDFIVSVVARMNRWRGDD